MPDQRIKSLAQRLYGAFGKDLKDLGVQTAHGLLQLLEVQLEGKKRMTTDAFLRGFPVETGTVLGKE